MTSLHRLLLLTIAGLLLAGLPAVAADRDLELGGNWQTGRVDWRVSLGLPIDTEFVAPLAAEYNWAYGSTLLGLNTREFGTRRYYVAIAGYIDDRLDIYDSEGPLSAAAMFKDGPYHISAGLADGRIICWLTAPGEFPRRLELSNRYVSGSGFDVIVEPPDPPSARWEDWTVVCSYQANVAGRSVATVVLDGTGRLLYELPGLTMDGVVRQLEYSRSALPGADMPWLLMSVEYGAADGGLRSAVGTAWYVPGEQWYTQGVRTTGRNNSSIYLDDGAAGGALAMMAWDDSDDFRNTGYVERLHLRIGNSRQVITDKGLPNLLNYYTSTQNWCFQRTVANRFPYIAFSDGADVIFGYSASKRGEQGADVGYKTFLLMQGARVSDDYGNDGALYPIQGLTMSTHWNTGEPHVFYIQNGSADYEGGQLFQLQFNRPGAGGK